MNDQVDEKIEEQVAPRDFTQSKHSLSADAATVVSTQEIVLVLLIAGFGFLIDVYDSILFAVVRVATLEGLGVTTAQMLPTTVVMFNMQMSGMILGGLLWGVLGDKKGRKSALFGSILLYSLANFATAFVHDIHSFAALRFLSGIGLAGEVGAAMTVAAEMTPRKFRTLGTAFVSTLGMVGALLASTICGTMPWRMAFLTAGAAGFLLLVARFSMKEPPVFSKLLHESGIKRGSLRLLFVKERVLKLLRCIMAAVPLFFVFGVLVSFAPEIWKDSPQHALITVAAIAMCYSIGETLGEMASGLLSQMISSRKKVMLGFLAGAIVCAIAMLHCPPNMYGPLCIPLGFFIGYWGVLMTSTAEQFGTNLRSTASTLVPNLMRASVIPINFAFGILATIFDGRVSAMIIGAVCMALAAISILTMEETFNKDLDFVET